MPVSPTPTPNADGVYIVPCGDIHVPLDKLHRLEEDCEPAGLVELSGDYAFDQQRVTETVLPDLLALLGAAAAEGHTVAVVSSYRSFEDPAKHVPVPRRHLRTGAGLARERPARPQRAPARHHRPTSPAARWATSSWEAFGNTPEGRWLAENAHEYGFILSYPEGMEEITGYSYEPWHFRWVGRETAAEVRASGLTLGEFLLR